MVKKTDIFKINLIFIISISKNMADKNLEKLLLAIENNDLKKIRELIAADLEVVERRTVRGERPLELAIESENTTIIKELIEAGAHPDYGGWTTPLDAAVRTGNIYIVNLLLEVGANPNLIVAGNLPLTTGASYGYLDIVKLLVKSDANVNLFDNNTGTTLGMAILNGNYNVFNYLAPLTSTELRIWAETYTLFTSVWDENVKAINFLAQSGVDINQVFEDDYTPLIYAVRKSQISSVQVLLKWKADVNSRNKKGKAALMYAVEDNKNLEKVLLLIEAGAKINTKDNDGNTALSLAIEAGNSEIIKLLIEAGAKQY